MADEAANGAAPDELAKRLPGLPVELGRIRVDETGFHRSASRAREELCVPWDEVNQVWHKGGALHVEARGREGRAKTLLRQRAGTKVTLAVLEMWKEQLVRRVERDGVLRGTAWNPQSRWTPHVITAGGLSLLGLAVVIGLGLIGTDTPPDAERRARMASAVSSGIGFVAAAFGAWMLARAREIEKLWSSWELTREGLVHWPDGVRHVLRPTPSDVVTPGAARIGGVRVPLERMSGSPVAAMLLLAMGEREGAELRAGPPLVWDMVRLIIAAVANVIAVSAILSGGLDSVYWIDIAIFDVAMLAAVVVRHAPRLDFPQLLENSRAMLERLGW